jgi:endonuclease/exonuclease/phosphatase family metal-dependent hydrolase
MMLPRRTTFLTVTLIGCFLILHSSHAQIFMSTGTYSQNFDSLTTIVGASVAWTNNVTLSGWYASKSVAPTDVTNYNAGTGSSTSGSLYSFGSAASSERGFGSLASSATGDIAYGLRCVNDTGFARTNIVISYTGEQWRAGNVATQTLAFAYQIGLALTNADARDTQNWIAFPALNFNSVNTNTPQALNGNAATNRVVFTNISLTGLVVPAGQELFVRWFDMDDSGFDNGLALDDFTISFGDAITNVPSPLDTNTAFSVVTYNVMGNFASDWSTNATQVQAIARELQYLNPDIIALNEIPNGLRYEMTNWMSAFFPNYNLAISPGTDGAIRNGVITRYSITRSNSWLDGASLTNFGYNGTFTRDLFEAQLSVPGFPQPLHVFVAHLKSGTSSSDDAARRSAEANAISNFFVTGFLATNSLHPYLLAGDMNEDIANPATGSQQPIQRLTNGSGLRLTTPLNPITLSPLTHSIQNTNGLNRRYDYIFPNPLLFSNIQNAQVFRTDVLNPTPPNLNSNDDMVASDHLPVMMTFNNPFTQPFNATSFTLSNQSLTLTWQTVPGQAYQVEASTNLADWTIFANPILATNFNYMMITNQVAPADFFRIRRLGQQ